jgi:signal transduction histidine kinase
LLPATGRGVLPSGQLEFPVLANSDDSGARGRTRPARHRRLWPSGVLGAGCVLTLLAAGPSFAAERPAPKRVLLLESFSRDFSPYSYISTMVRADLTQRQGAPIEFLQVSLEAQSDPPLDEGAVVAYVRALCGLHPPDLVITSAGPAFQFYKRHQQGLLPGVPAVHGGAEGRFFRDTPLSAAETAVSVRLDVPVLFENILEILPETRQIYLVFGDSPLERYWSAQFGDLSASLGKRVRVDSLELEGISFDEVLKRAAALPPRSAIFFGLMLRDVNSVPHQNERAFERLSRTANSPVFGWSTATLGRGSVGGRLVPVETLAYEIARMADRILRGDSPASIPVRTIPLGSPIYDARELARWGIDERRLPPASEIRFRPPSFWEQHSGRIVGVAAILLLQAAGIGALLVSRTRRQRAEQEAARLRSELAHVGRVTVLGQLSSSLAHELSQPLGAILRNAEAAELFLATEAPDLEEIRAIVADIKSDDDRARDVIERMRGLLRRRELNRVPLEPASLVDGVFRLLRPDARNRGVQLDAVVARDLPAVTGDPVHIQQVLLNLFVNAMDAMEDTPPDARVLSVDVRARNGTSLEIAVSDTGPGIPPEAMAHLFEPFHTTKRDGMGMGLAISRTLVEAHGGELWTEGAPGRGATFVVSLPAGGA